MVRAFGGTRAFSNFFMPLYTSSKLFMHLRGSSCHLMPLQGSSGFFQALSFGNGGECHHHLCARRRFAYMLSGGCGGGSSGTVHELGERGDLLTKWRHLVNPLQGSPCFLEANCASSCLLKASRCPSRLVRALCFECGGYCRRFARRRFAYMRGGGCDGSGGGTVQGCGERGSLLTAHES